MEHVELSLCWLAFRERGHTYQGTPKANQKPRIFDKEIHAKLYVVTSSITLSKVHIHEHQLHNKKPG